MANLRTERTIDQTAQPVTDDAGGRSALTLATEEVGVAGGLTVGRTGEGAVLLTLATERRWAFRQLRTGAGTALELASLGGAGGQPVANKDFIINTTGGVGIGTATPGVALDVRGSIRASEDILLAGADCAEDFDIDDGCDVTPGTVLVIGDRQRLSHCVEPYDRRVAGIISGAERGDRPGIVLGRRTSPSGPRVPLALVGTVWCRADAGPAPIRVGDLLTTSPLAGHAMRAMDASRSFGAVVGKALSGLTAGAGLVRVLVTLQ